MKNDAQGGCYGSSALAIVVPRASWGKVFVEKGEPRAKPQTVVPTGQKDQVFLFCFSSLAEREFAAARSGQGRAVCGRGGAHP